MGWYVIKCYIMPVFLGGTPSVSSTDECSFVNTYLVLPLHSLINLNIAINLASIFVIGSTEKTICLPKYNINTCVCILTYKVEMSQTDNKGSRYIIYFYCASH
jgi:hypothetical protein